MSEIKDGGPAFPADPNWLEPGTAAVAKQMARGMTLRDYMAAKAMNALILSEEPEDGQSIEDYIDETAKAAYLYADAMLKARGAA